MPEIERWSSGTITPGFACCKGMPEIHPLQAMILPVDCRARGSIKIMVPGPQSSGMSAKKRRCGTELCVPNIVV
jgi:hypothetical protein